MTDKCHDNCISKDMALKLLDQYKSDLADKVRGMKIHDDPHNGVHHLVLDSYNKACDELIKMIEE